MKPKQNIIVIGASGHAKVVIDIIEKQNKYNVVGLIDSYKSKENKIFEYSILGTENELPKLMEQYNFNTGIIAIGDNWTRKLMYEKIIRLVPNFDFIKAIHPNARIGKNVKIGKGTVVMPGTIINSDTTVGSFCILNTKASLDHDCLIKKFSSLAPNATLGGNVTVGAYSAICLGANVIQDIKIGKHAIIGAGALVNRDVESYKMVYGVPSKVVKTIDKGEKYLYHNEDLTKNKLTVNDSGKLEEITEKEAWDALLKEMDAFDFYHTFDYHHLSKTDGETPLLLKYTGKNCVIAIPLLVRVIKGTNYKDATSVYGYAGPICKGIITDFNNEKFKNTITNYFLNNNFVSVFSRLNPFIDNQNCILNTLGTIVSQGKVVNIEIQNDLETQRQAYQSRLKTHINKSRRLCHVKLASTPEDLQEFKAIYYENMNRVNAKKYYYFDDAYFEQITNSADFKSEILLAIDNETGQTIAGCQFITTNNIVQYHLSGTKNDFLHLTPTKLLIDEMRLIATQRGHQFFNLGGGLGGKEDDSLFNFKSSFSKDFKEFNLWKFIVNQKVYDDLVSKKGITNTSDFFPLYRLLNDLNVNA